MFKIRKEQLEAFKRVAVDNYEDRMVVHLKKFFPEQCAELGYAKIRETIQYGIRRAASYGIVAERDVCLYLDIMFTFGRDFDKDSKFPWAQHILNNKALSDPTARINRLHDVALEHVRAGTP